MPSGYTLGFMFYLRGIVRGVAAFNRELMYK